MDRYNYLDTLFSKLTGGLLTGLVIAVAGYTAGASADDTEVFFGQVDSTVDVAPNVLFVLDTSGSMGIEDAGQTGTRMARLKTAMQQIFEQTVNVNVGLMSLNGTYGGGPVLYPITPIDKAICSGVLCGEVLVRNSINNVDNDTEQALSSGQMLGGGYNLSVGGQEGPNGVEQVVGLRFEDLDIPQGARILSATLEMDSVYSNNGAASMSVYGQDADDAESFTNARNDLSDRPVTSASALFDPGAWVADESYESGDIRSVVQEIVDRPGWCGGNSLALMLEGTDSRSIKSLEHVIQDANSQISSSAPTLRLTYDTTTLLPGEGCITRTLAVQIDSDADDAEQRLSQGNVFRTHSYLQIPRDGNNEQRLGLRFVGLDLPRGTDIVDARVEFTVDRVFSGTPSAWISGEDAGDSSAFSGNRWELSNRQETSAGELWSMTDNPSVGSTMTTPDISDVIEEITDRSDWQPGNALTVMMDPGGSGSGYRQFASYDLQPGISPKLLVRYNDTVGGLSSSVDENAVTARTEMLDIINQLGTSGGTPLIGAHYEAAQYLLGKPVDHGSRRGYFTSRRYRVSHPDSYTGGSLYTPPGCSADNPDDRDCTSEEIRAGSSPATYISPIETTCQTSHVVILSDGIASPSNTTSRVQNLIGESTCDSNASNEACGTDLARWLYETDHNETVARVQNIKTHTIAFNLDDPRYLQSVAEAGGGGFYPADSADELVAAFDAIITGSQSIDTSFTAPGATVNQFNRLAHREDVYFALFKPTDRPTWQGNLKRYRLGFAETATDDAADTTGSASGDDGTEILDVNDELAVNESTGFFFEDATSFWDNLDADGAVTTAPDGDRVHQGGAAVRIAHDGVDNRKLYTYLGDETNIAASGVDLTAEANAFHESNTGITDALLGIQNKYTNASDQSQYRRELVQWARGMDITDDDGDGDTTESRRHMGDPMHARPVIVNYRESDESEDRSLVYVATNEGLLHAIDSQNGNELWAFTPKDLMRNHQLFFENAASTPHPYGLDGTMTLWRDDPNENFVIETSKDESVYLYVSMRRGGKNYYAFNITDPDRPELAWVIRGGADGTPGFEELGQSWSKATHTQMLIGDQPRDVLVFGAGYDTNQDPDSSRDANGNSVTMQQTPDSQGRGLFVVDAKTGELLWSATGPAQGASDTSTPDQRFNAMKYSMPADIRIVDIDFDGLADQLYASDMGGQIWRFDVTGNATTGSELLQGGVVADLADSDREDQRRFYSEPDVALIQQDGERYLAVTIGSGWRAHPLNDIVQDAMYMVKVRDIRSAPEGYGRLNDSGEWVPITESDLVQTNRGAATTDADYVNGWYLRFPDSGEKVLGTSLIFKNVVYFTTYVPASDVVACDTAIGSGYVYALSITDGKPSQDFNDDGQVNDDYSGGVNEDMRRQLSHEGPPPNVAVLIGEDANGNAADPRVVIGTEILAAPIENGTTRTFWVDTGVED